MSVSVFSNNETTYLSHRGMIRKSGDATQYRTEYGNIWIPNKLIQMQDKSTVAIPTWFARQKKIKIPSNGVFK